MGRDVLVERRKHTDEVVKKLASSLQADFGADFDNLIGDHTCVYATGSCGRGEMGPDSDLDAYVIRVTGDISTSFTSESNRIKEAIKHANKEAKLRELDNAGGYLDMASATRVLDLLGSPMDDSEGVLTKRILMLLESRVLVGEKAHQDLVDRVLDAYWINEQRHQNDFLPYMLVNDIVRYWRIVLLNHESRLRKREKELDEEGISDDEREAMMLAERRYRSYKLRLPRCLTCFSALAYFLALTPTEPAHVSKDDVRKMVKMTPLERLRQLPSMVRSEQETVKARVEGLVEELLEVYRSYLQRTEAGKQKLLKQLQDDAKLRQQISDEGQKFTKAMFQLVQELGGGRPLHRHMLV